MRIIKEKTLYLYCSRARYRSAADAVRAWIYEVRVSDWSNAKELKATYGNASVITSKRVVFNIKGNDFRLIADIEYKMKIVFIVWFGTHTEYDKIDVKTIKYES